MLLAAPLGESPRDVAGAPRRRARARARRRAAASTGSRSPAPASSTSSSPTPGTGGRWRASARPARASGRPRPPRRERILVEFVSANPTGPLHVGGGRHAAYGDALVRLLEAVGHEVEREYYVNDAGGQVDRFAASIAARMTGERAARGRLRRRVRRSSSRERLAGEGIDPADREALGRRGVELMLEEVRATLDRFGVSFDTWFSERDLYARGEVEAALAQLERARPHLPQRRRALAAHAPTSATTRTGS